MSNDHVQTEKNQIDLLIQEKKDEISALEDLKKSFDEEQATPTSSEVAQDEGASQEERTAAATQAASANPEKVFEAQSAPSPSTHAEQFQDETEAQNDTEETAAPEADAADSSVEETETPEEKAAESSEANEADTSKSTTKKGSSKE